MIYMDHAATTKTSPAAGRAMTAAMEEVWGNPSSLYRLGQRAAGKLPRARGLGGGCIRATPGGALLTSRG